MFQSQQPAGIGETIASRQVPEVRIVGLLWLHNVVYRCCGKSLGTAFSETICLLSPSSAAYSTYIVDESFGMRNNCVNSMTRCTARRSGGESFLPSC